MKTKSMILMALLTLITLTVVGCGLFHGCGPRHGKPGCDMTAPCAQQKDCQKALENKPCCNKMKGAETPAQ